MCRFCGIMYKRGELLHQHVCHQMFPIKSYHLKVDQIVNFLPQMHETPSIWCMICRNILRNPVRCSTCQNNFCDRCVNDNPKSRDFRCQFFGCSSYTFEEVQPLTYQVLKRLVIRCEECGEHVNYEDYNTHQL